MLIAPTPTTTRPTAVASAERPPSPRAARRQPRPSRLGICAAVALAALAGASAPRPLAAQQPATMPADGAPRTITVTGQGSITAAPDRARILFWVETRAATAAAAARENAARQQRVIAALRAAGIPERSIQTTGYNLSPDYRFEPQTQEQRLVGYVARNGVQVQVQDIARVGALIDSAITAGANMVGDLTFESSRAAQLEREALAAAVGAACRDAQAIARAAGVELSQVLDIASGQQMAGPPQPLMRASAAQMEAMPTPIQPGELGVGAMVTIRYAIGTTRGVACR